MIETYLIGSVGQSLKRIRQLRQIVQGPYPQGNPPSTQRVDASLARAER